MCNLIYRLSTLVISELWSFDITLRCSLKRCSLSYNIRYFDVHFDYVDIDIELCLEWYLDEVHFHGHFEVQIELHIE